MVKRVFVPVVVLLLFVVIQGNALEGSTREFSSPPVQQPTLQPEATPASDQVVTWESLEGPYERLIYGLLVDQADPQVLYAGTWGAGLYRSTDAGATWYPTYRRDPDRKPETFRIRAVAQSYGDDLFISRWGRGVWHSADRGETWELISGIGNGILPPIDDLDRNPLLVNQFLIFTTTNEIETIFTATHDGVFYSTNNGDSWQQAVEGIPETASTRNMQTLAVKGDSLYAGSFGGGVFVSTDWGENWQSIGPPSGLKSKVFAVLPLKEGLLIGTAGAGVLWRGDEGKTWEPRNEGLPDNPFARRVQALIADDEGTVYVGTVDHGVYRSADGGRTWKSSSAGLTGRALSIVHLSTDLSGETIYAGTYGDGVYRSTDRGETWQPLREGLPNPSFEVQSLAVSGQDLLAGTLVGGVYTANLGNGKGTWRRLPEGLPIGAARDIADIIISGEGEDEQRVTLAAGTGIFTGTFHSPSGSVLWTQVKGDLPVEDLLVAGLAQGHQDPGVVYAALRGGEGLYRSTDGGLTWSAARGDLRLELATAVSDLVVGADDDTLYVGFGFEGVWATRNRGQTWESLQQAGPDYVSQLAFESRSFWQQALLGGPRRTLCALALDGIYCSYDDGQHWELSIADKFSTMLMDPARPGAVYAVSPATVLDVPAEPTPVPTPTGSPPDVAGPEAADTPTGATPTPQPTSTPAAEITDTQPITRPATFWISRDAGRTWHPTNPDLEEATGKPGLNFTVLALDPTDSDVIYAGTSRHGVFRGRLHLPSIWGTPRAILGVMSFVALPLLLVLMGVLFVAHTWWSLSRPYGVLLGQALALRTSRRERLRLVLGPAPPLSPLQRLTLAVVPARRFGQEEVQRVLGDVQAHATFSQMANALHEMVEKLGLLSQDGLEFRLAAPGVERIARALFWPERSLLAKRVREENELYQDTRRFFEAAGFLVHSTFSQFILLSDQPRYAIYEGLYAQVASQPQVTPGDIDRMRDEVARFYSAQVRGRLAFLVMALPPPVETLQRIARLREEEGLTLVLLTHSAIRQALFENAAASRIEFSLRRSAGRSDLFQLDSPATDDLDFFGRRAELEHLVNWVHAGQTALLQGMPRVGKTSLAWQVSDRLANDPVAYLHLNHPDVDRLGLYSALLLTLLADLTRKLPHMEWPLDHGQVGVIDRSQFQADLDRILGGLDSQAARPFLALIVDGVAVEQLERTGTWSDWVALAELVGQESRLGLLAVLDTLGDEGSTKLRDGIFQQRLSLLPLPAQDSADLISGVAAQMNLQFTEEAMQRLHLAAGGHPQMLRQLSSLTAQLREDEERVVSVDLVEEALERYIVQPGPLLRLLWRSLSPADQQFLAQLALLEEAGAVEEAAGFVAPVDGTMERLVAVGWIREEDGRPRLFSQTLARWLIVQGLV